MKTVEQLENNISNCKRLLLDTVDKKEAKKLSEEITFLKNCKDYLQFNPNKDFLLNQLIELQKKIDLLNEQYNTWFNQHPSARHSKSPRSLFNKETGIAGYKKQLETLQFLLN